MDLAAITARLTEAAASGETLELILVVRGKVKPGPRGARWRVRLEAGDLLTFRADSVVAVTPVARARSTRR
jgi:hypothetical protein